MKITYFVKNGRTTRDDATKKHDLEQEYNAKVYFANGSVEYGFEDSCQAVYLSADFPHIEKWAIGKGIEVIKPSKPVSEPEPEPDTQPEQDVKPFRRGRKPKSEQEPEQDQPSTDE